MEDRTGLWASLSPELQRRVDAELRHRRVLPVVLIVRDEAGLDPQPGLAEAVEVAELRLRWLAERGLVEPEPTVTVADVLDIARAIPDPIAAIEASWDGDTQGWFVRLDAIVERPGREHEHYDEVGLTLIRRGGDIRIFNGQVPPWPESAEAIEMGQGLASALSVPFFFSSPETPDIDLPRWWDQTPTNVGRATGVEGCDDDRDTA